MAHNRQGSGESDLPAKLSKPALRGLTGAGYNSIAQLTRITEAEIMQLHGVGPQAIALLRDALGARGLSFAGDEKGGTDVSDTKQVAANTGPNAAIERLGMLVGEWRCEINMPHDPPIVTAGRTTIGWLEEGPFLIQHSSVDHPAFPTGIAILGSDDSNGAYSMLYFDSRSVSRVYGMSLSTEEWRLWREAPGFSQRFTGIFSDSGNTITGYWERSTDGSNWELDFDLRYEKVR